MASGAEDAAPDPKRRALYGRSKGKTLRAYHAQLVKDLLPKLELEGVSLANPAGPFAFSPRELHLEIGFGGGEHLAQRARETVDVGFFGCEPFVNGVAKLLAAIDGEGLANIRIRAGDAREVLEALPTGSLHRIYVLYPDPWPKRRQWKRRFISPETIAAFARVLKEDGEVRFATDIDDYAGWTLCRFLAAKDFEWLAAKADDWRLPWTGWTATRYETKARAEGRPSAYLTFRRRASSQA
jgi:tRNA (guanine-N7-)-methyltransferase